MSNPRAEIKIFELIDKLEKISNNLNSVEAQLINNISELSTFKTQLNTIKEKLNVA